MESKVIKSPDSLDKILQTNPFLRSAKDMGEAYAWEKGHKYVTSSHVLAAILNDEETRIHRALQTALNTKGFSTQDLVAYLETKLESQGELARPDQSPETFKENVKHWADKDIKLSQQEISSLPTEKYYLPLSASLEKVMREDIRDISRFLKRLLSTIPFSEEMLKEFNLTKEEVFTSLVPVLGEQNSL